MVFVYVCMCVFFYCCMWVSYLLYICFHFIHYYCSDPGKCNFFQWGDVEQSDTGGFSSYGGGGGGGGGRSNNTSFTPPTGPIPNCYCGNAAVNRTVQKEGANQGRVFFGCAKQREEV